jgi:hypothetical protein
MTQSIIVLTFRFSSTLDALPVPAVALLSLRAVLVHSHVCSATGVTLWRSRVQTVYQEQLCTVTSGDRVSTMVTSHAGFLDVLEGPVTC